MEEILKNSGTRGRFAKWAAKIRTYSISYVRTNKAKGHMVNKFLKQKELLPHMWKGKKKGAPRQSNEPQCQGHGGLVASAGKGMKDLHVFVDSQILVDQMEGSRTPTTEEINKYMEEIMDATTLFHRFRITHLPKNLNFKAEVLTGIATIKLEFLNQEVSVGIKTRPSVKVVSDDKERKATSKVPMRKPNCNWETSGSN
ncbi:gag-pol polyprotein [Tanacetum coccineum]